MKKSVCLFAAIALAAVLIPAFSFAESSGTSSIYVSVARYEPFPAEAGQFVDVWLKVENLGSGTSNDVTLELLPKFPFSLESGDTVQELGPVASGSALLVKYRVKVDEKATSGDNILQVRFKPAPLSAWVTKDITIFIQLHDAVLSVSDIIADEMVPGKIQTISLSLENMADAYLKDVSASIDFSSASLPFAPIDSVNEKRISSIDRKEKKEMFFEIITYPDAASGVYKVPLLLKYSDATGKNYSRQYLLGLVVNSKPDFEIAIQKYDIMQEGTSGTVTVSISNTGPGVIKFMAMEVLPSDKYEILGERSIYLGNLNPDDYQTGALKLYVNKGATARAKTIPVNIVLTYRDGLNNMYSKNATLDARVYSNEEISAFGLAPSSGSSTAIYAVVALVAIYYLYRKFFKKHRA